MGYLKNRGSQNELTIDERSTISRKKLKNNTNLLNLQENSLDTDIDFHEDSNIHPPTKAIAFLILKG